MGFKSHFGVMLIKAISSWENRCSVKFINCFTFLGHKNSSPLIQHIALEPQVQDVIVGSVGKAEKDKA